MEIIGTITTKDIKEGIKNDNPWKRALYTIDNGNIQMKMSTFNQDIIDTYNIGDTVKAIYETKQVGEKTYTNLIGFEEPSESDVAQTKLKENIQSGSGAEKNIDTQTYIVRQNSNQRAIEALDLLFRMNPKSAKELLEANEGGILNVIDVFANHFESKVFR